eukprot:2437115-Rhodomonas_salina.2
MAAPKRVAVHEPPQLPVHTASHAKLLDVEKPQHMQEAILRQPQQRLERQLERVSAHPVHGLRPLMARAPPHAQNDRLRAATMFPFHCVVLRGSVKVVAAICAPTAPRRTRTHS